MKTIPGVLLYSERCSTLAHAPMLPAAGLRTAKKEVPAVKSLKPLGKLKYWDIPSKLTTGLKLAAAMLEPDLNNGLLMAVLPVATPALLSDRNLSPNPLEMPPGD
ncbi:MAG: hypothetical protein KF746_23905 [Chitinophagaceae bacterium]|nr:hypothetical protein [Chitinophagaceae bacterium]